MSKLGPFQLLMTGQGKREIRVGFDRLFRRHLERTTVIIPYRGLKATVMTPYRGLKEMSRPMKISTKRLGQAGKNGIKTARPGLVKSRNSGFVIKAEKYVLITPTLNFDSEVALGLIFGIFF